MKKLLLSLLSVLTFAGIVSANTATISFPDLGYENAQDVPSVKVNDDITISFEKGTNNNGTKYYNSGNALRVYAGNIITVTGAEGVKITEAAFTFDGTNTFKDGTTVEPGTYADGKWTGDANSFVITTGGTSGHARIKTITFTYTGGTGGGTVNPNPNPDPDPTPGVEEVADIAAFKALTKGDVRAIKSDAVAVRQLGANLWIKDNSGYLLVYGNINGSTAPTFENGDVIKGGYQGELDIYSGLPEMKNTTNFVKNGTTTPVEPAAVNTGDADGEPLCSYIKLTNCKIEGSGRNYTADDGSGAVAIYTPSTSFAMPTGEGYTIYAFVSIYGTKIQLTPVEVVSASGKETVATPYFTPAAGAVTPGTKVAIKCSTADATIHYTLDGSEPSAASTIYTEEITINEDVTIKAIAVKKDWDDSEVASASYTVIVPSSKDVTFNFADPSTLTPTYTAADYEDDGTTGNKLINVQDVEFTAKGVTVKAVYTDPSNTGTQARLYQQSSGTNSFRVYNKSSIVVTAPADNLLSQVVFEYYNGATSYNKVTAPAEGTWAAPIWNAPEAGVASVSFVCTGTQQIKTITVTCKDDLSGVEEVAVDNENAPVEYFNLQGVKVQNPENGLFIRRQGNNVSKVIIK